VENKQFELPNLPYLMDGNLKLTETLAILEYIVLKTQRVELLGNEDPKVNALIL
jgi:glutathione S-transferase